VFLVCTVGFIVYSLVSRPGGETTPFAYFSESINNLFIDFEWPKGEFFGIKNFPIDWPYVTKVSSPEFTLPAIVSYVMLIVWIVTLLSIFTSTLRFIARLNRARVKSVEVFSKSLDNANFNEGSL
jgi:hypothetical protein